MKHLHGATHLRAGLLAMLLLTAGGLVGAGHAARTTPGLTAAQATACIQTAVAAQAGMVTKVEVEEKRGQRLCEVRLVDEAGRRHTLQVDATTNQVLKLRSHSHALQRR